MEAEVAFGHDEVGSTGEGAEDRDGSGNSVADDVGVHLAANVVEDHHVGQVRTDLPGREAFRRERNHQLVDAGKPTLTLRDDLRLERTCGVRKFDRMRENRGFAGRTDFTHPTRA